MFVVGVVATAGIFAVVGDRAPCQVRLAQASCTPPALTVARDNSELVFLGAVRAIENKWERQLAWFEVSVVYKGHVPKVIVSDTPKDGTSWGSVVVGHSYLVFSGTDPPNLRECSIRDMTSSVTSADISTLGSGRPPDIADDVYFPSGPPSRRSDHDACACDLSATSEKSSMILPSLGLAVVLLVVRRRSTSARINEYMLRQKRRASGTK